MFVLVVAAAGSGERLGADVPKALVELGGATLLSHALQRLGPLADRVVITSPPGHEDRIARLGAAFDADVVTGGDTRTDSVVAGLIAADPDDDDVVAIHDAARALAPAQLLSDLLAVIGSSDVLAAAPALPVADTLKRTAGVRVVTTVSRADLRAVQTPQVATARTWRSAHAGRPQASDDLGLVEQAVADGRLRGRVVLLPGSVLARKVTLPMDLALAGAMLDAEDTLLAIEHRTGDDAGRQGAAG